MTLPSSTHWGRVTHIWFGNLTVIGSDNGLSPGRRQAITWTNVGILLIGPQGTNFSEMLIEIHTFSFKKIHLKMSSGKWRPFCLGLNVLNKLCLREVKRSATCRSLYSWWVDLLTVWMFNSLWPSDTIWPHKSGSTLAQVMACCLTAPSHYLNQCWLIISKVQWHPSESNFPRDASAFSHWN